MNYLPTTTQDFAMYGLLALLLYIDGKLIVEWMGRRFWDGIDRKYGEKER